MFPRKISQIVKDQLLGFEKHFYLKKNYSTDRNSRNCIIEITKDCSAVTRKSL